MKLTSILVAGVTVIVLAACGGQNKEGRKAFSTQEEGAVSGEAIFKKTCVSCHMADGKGVENVYPPLAGSDYLTDRDRAIMQVIKGSSGEIVVNGKKYNNSMPPQALNDEEVAAVLTYVFTDMGNNGSAVTVEEVKKVREKL